MTQYRRKRATIDALQWTNPPPEAYPGWIIGQIELVLNDGRLLLKTRDVVEPNDWVVIEDGYPVRVIANSLFHDFYEASL